MEILYRNFTKLLSIGVFGENCPVEDMSEFKWNKLLRIAGICDVEDLYATVLSNQTTRRFRAIYT